MSSAVPTADVVVVGGGLIGTAIAWRLAQSGADVVVVAGERAAAASAAAAGMLAPVTETTFTDQAIVPLNLASLRLFPDFVTELEQVSGEPAGLRRTPTLSVASNADDAARLRLFADFLDRSELPCERLTSRECKRHEPLLAPDVRAGLLVPDDWSCDNRLLWRALLVANERVGVRELPGFVHGIVADPTGVIAVELADGSPVATRHVVIANGAWAAQLTGVPPVPVRPVKGQILRLDPGRLPGPVSTIRAFTRGSEIYLVPRAGGREVVVGATVEEQGFDGRVTAGGVYELLRDARAVLPMTAEYALSETTVGWRPGTPDNAPILGRSAVAGLVWATGHYRNGVLLTPITAELICRLVLTGTEDPLLAPFGADRFRPAPQRVPAGASA